MSADPGVECRTGSRGQMMYFSRAALLAVGAMAYMDKIGGTIPSTIIAAELEVSREHLGKVLQQLTRSGLLHSRRGPKGGYSIRRDPEKTSLLEIISAIDGPLKSKVCVATGRKCPISGYCRFHSLAQTVRELWETQLASITVAEIGRAPVGDP